MRPVGPLRPIDEEGDAELSAGLYQPAHAVAGLAAISTHCAARAATLGYANTQIVFRRIGAERDLGSMRHHQQFILPSVQSDQQPIQSLVAVAL